MKNVIQNIFYQKDGPYTQELLLKDSPLGIGKFPERVQPDAVTKTICGYCSTGCSLDVHLKDNEPVNLTPTQQYPVNLGAACPKGWEALTPLKARDRALTPLLRNPRGELEATDWPTAMESFVNNFVKIQQRHGKPSVAFLSTGQITTEEMAVLGVLAKFGMGILHGDGNTRQCMATSVVAYKEAFGFDAPPYAYKDFEESDCLVFIGANPCIAHPIMWERVLMNRHRPEIIVVDPRMTETAMAATRHYALRPKTDLTLLYGLAHCLIEKDWINKEYIERHTTGFEGFKRHVQQFPPERVSRTTGLTTEQIRQFAVALHRGQRVSFWWTMGVNQGYEAVRTAQAVINLALMTGNIGRPGTGANSITGQCNAMGSRLYSNTTNLIGGHDFADAAHRQKIAAILDVELGAIPLTPGWAYDQIIEGIVQEKIKGLWVIATNPLHSWINQAELKRYIKNLDFLVVQDMYATTETARSADLVLPAAGWGEKDGTFINSERRIGLVKKVAEAPGKAKTDFEIFKMVAEYWGCGRLLRTWNTAVDVFQSLKRISQGQPCDMSGIQDYQMLEACGGIQWPFREGEELQHSERRLFEDGRFYHADGRARFIFEDVRPKPESASAEYPFELLTGRGTASQWHTQTRTGKSKVLQQLYPKDIYVEINPEDARRLEIAHNQWVYVATRRATIRAQAVPIPTVKPGQAFIPMHYPETNQLTFPAVDPYSRQPSYKTCAAQISKNLYPC